MHTINRGDHRRLGGSLQAREDVNAGLEMVTEMDHRNLGPDHRNPEENVNAGLKKIIPDLERTIDT